MLKIDYCPNALESSGEMWLLYEHPCYLLLGNPHVVSDIGENSGLNEEALPSQAFASTLQLGALGHTALDELQDLVVLFLINLQEKSLDDS